MKKMILAGLLLGLVSAVFAIDFSVEARTDLSYTSYIHNSAYDAMALMQTMTAVNAYEKIRLKANADMDTVKFKFDGRIYLRPEDPALDYAIDSAYFSYENGPFVLYAGKQRLKWGTGYFWNPTDNLQPAKNIFRTTEDLEGIVALRAEYSNDFVTPSFILIPSAVQGSSQLLDNFDSAIQLYKLVETIDIYLNFTYKADESSLGAAFSWDTGFVVINAEVCRKTDRFHIFDFSYNGAAGPDFVAGASKTIGDFFINAEYYRNNSGIDNAGYAIAVDSDGFGLSMNKKNYLAYAISYTWDQKLGIGLTGMHGLDDGTSYIFPTLSWMENQNFDVQLSLMQNLTAEGIKEGNYSTPFYSAVELRINAYF